MDCGTCKGAIEDATHRIQRDKMAYEHKRLLTVCLTVVVVVALVCGAVVGCFTIKKQQETIIEQQYALNMQYASLMEYLAGAEVSTETIESNDGGVAAKIEGNGNAISSGSSITTSDTGESTADGGAVDGED